MKLFIFPLIALTLLSLNLKAQELLADAKSTNSRTFQAFSEDTIMKSSAPDTAVMHIGKKECKVIDNEGRTTITWGKNKNKKNNGDKFKGHWEGLELGFNAFDKIDYSMYNPADNNFMSLNQGKSMEIDFNFYELNISLAKSYVGLISGLGLSFNNYRFDNPYTLKKGPEITEPVLIGYDNLSKTKLAVSYLRVPLLLEVQIPVNHNEGRVYLNGGVIGGVKIGSHTKVKHGDTKDKDHNGFNINSFNYAATARIGYKDIGLFVNYSLTPFFKTGMGPDLTPFTIGISFLN
jgi:hypothetical protein